MTSFRYYEALRYKYLSISINNTKQDPTVKQKTNRPSIEYCEHSNAIFQNTKKNLNRKQPYFEHDNVEFLSTWTVIWVAHFVGSGLPFTPLFYCYTNLGIDIMKFAYEPGRSEDRSISAVKVLLVHRHRNGSKFMYLN